MVEITQSQRKATYALTVEDCILDNILASGSKMGAAAYAYKEKKLKLSAVGIWNNIKLAVLKPIISGAMKKIAVEVSLDCPQNKNPGDVCQHGGECNTGNCVGVGQGPPWTYRCSCDPFRFVGGNTEGECPVGSDVAYEAPDGPLGPGEVCRHGGECESGNCIGVGQGPPWTYKCSCDPFKFVGGNSFGECP